MTEVFLHDESTVGAKNAPTWSYLVEVAFWSRELKSVGRCASMR